MSEVDTSKTAAVDDPGVAQTPYPPAHETDASPQVTDQQRAASDRFSKGGLLLWFIGLVVPILFSLVLFAWSSIVASAHAHEDWIRAVGASFTLGARLTYVMWLVVVVLYLVLSAYERTHGHSKPAKDGTLLKPNFYAPLIGWGVFFSVTTYHATYVLGVQRPLLVWSGVDLGQVFLWLGVAIGLLGLFLLVSGRIRLDGYWAVDIYTYPDQKLVEDGIYRIVRHPIYGGQCLLAWATLLLSNQLWLLPFPVLLMIYNLARAANEEKCLDRALDGEYTAYAARTRSRMVPGVF